MKTVAVVAAAPYDELLSDVGFIGALMGQPQLPQLLEMQFAFFVQSVDRTKPWGVIVLTDGAALHPMACLPVTKPDDLLAVAPAFGAQINDLGDGMKELLLPNENSIFVKSQGGWSFIAQSAESLDQVPADPEAEFAKLTGDYDIAANVEVQNAPEMYRQLAITAMQSGLQQGLQQRPDETDEQYQARAELAQAQMQQIVDFVNEIETFTLGWRIDAAEQRTYVDFGTYYTPGGKMAEQLAAMEPPQTSFAGFYQPTAAATLTTAQKVDMSKVDAEWYKSQQEQMRQMLKVAREQMLTKLREELDISDASVTEAIDSAAGDVFDAFTATIESGRMDAGAALDMKPEAVTFVAGTYVVEPAKIEAALKKLSPVASDLKSISAIEMNTGKHGDVTFHKIVVNVPEDNEEARNLFGEQLDVAVGIGPEAVYLAFGEGHMEAVGQAIDASASEPNKRVPLFELAVSLAPIMESATAKAEGDQREVAQTIATMLRNEAQGRDHVRILGQTVENGQRWRLEAEEGVLRAIGKAAAEQQRKQMEQMQQQFQQEQQQQLQ